MSGIIRWYDSPVSNRIESKNKSANKSVAMVLELGLRSFRILTIPTNSKGNVPVEWFLQIASRSKSTFHLKFENYKKSTNDDTTFKLQQTHFIFTIHFPDALSTVEGNSSKPGAGPTSSTFILPLTSTL